MKSVIHVDPIAWQPVVCMLNVPPVRQDPIPQGRTLFFTVTCRSWRDMQPVHSYDS